MEGRQFFKIMMPGFQEKLNLPQAFCKNLAQETPEKAILKTRSGRWRVSVCKNQEGLIWFQNGWPDFVHHHDLNVGDFVVFEGTGSFHFNAVVFGINGCKKDPTQAPPKPTKRMPEEVSYEGKKPFFNMKIKRYHGIRKSNVAIPQWFWRANKIEENTSLVLRDRCGREWKVETKMDSNSYYKMVGRGWHDFYVGNNLKFGDVCVFYLTARRTNRRSKKCSVVLDAHIFPTS